MPKHEISYDDEKVKYTLSVKIIDNIEKYILFNETITNEAAYERSSGGGFIFSSLFWPPGLGMPIYVARASGRAERNGIVAEKLIKETADQMFRAITNNYKLISYDARKNNPSMAPGSLLFTDDIVSDVDTLPAITPRIQKNKFAVVIGIENYRQKLQKAEFAVRDAKRMSEYLVRVLGYPEENVITLLNDHATKSDFEKYLGQWLQNNVEKDGTVFVYYSGHGAPNPATGDAYLVPYDGDPTFIDQTGFSVKRLYTLGKLPAKSTVVALDSCFSGAGGRSVMAKGARPVVFAAEPALAVPMNMVVMTSSQGAQISTSYDEKGHGLFTYFLLKGIKGAVEEDKYSKIELSELFNYLKPQVERISRKIYNTEQSPGLIAPNETLRRLELM